MADVKITALTALTAADPANDVIPIVDVSDTTMAASGTTKKISVNNILGASGTATLASATITGAATVGTTLGVTGVSTFAAGTAALPALTTTGDTNTGIYYPAADTFAITTGGTERARFNSTGAFVLAGGTTGANGIGVAFPATQSASSDANTLDDYEEGTFTPTIAGTSTAGTGTYTTQFGRYTKVGRVVTCDITITWTAHDGTGNLEVAGLPFSVLTTTNYTASAAIGYFDNVTLTAGNVPAFSMLWFNTTKLRGYQYPTGGGGVTSVPMDSTGQMNLSITYIVA
jgi:hypothetical protein